MIEGEIEKEQERLERERERTERERETKTLVQRNKNFHWNQGRVGVGNERAILSSVNKP